MTEPSDRSGQPEAQPAADTPGQKSSNKAAIFVAILLCLLFIVGFVFLHCLASGTIQAPLSTAFSQVGSWLEKKDFSK